jgi:hypothetical protein
MNKMALWELPFHNQIHNKTMETGTNKTDNHTFDLDEQTQYLTRLYSTKIYFSQNMLYTEKKNK